MQKKILHRFLVGLCGLAFSVGFLWGGSMLIRASEKPKRITILCTNDTLGAIMACG